MSNMNENEVNTLKILKKNTESYKEEEFVIKSPHRDHLELKYIKYKPLK